MATEIPVRKIFTTEEIVDEDKQTKLTVKRKNMGFTLVPAALFMIGIPACSGVVSIMWKSKPTPGYMYGLIIFLFMLLFWVIKLLTKPKYSEVLIGQKGITISGMLFPYENINTIGYKNNSDGKIYNPGTFSGGLSQDVAMYNYAIYMVYGIDEVEIFPRGLNNHEVNSVFQELKSICTRYGYKFN